MAASRFRSSKYQREQRITVISWAVALAVATSCIAFHSWWTARSSSSDQDSPPTAPTMSMPVWLAQSESSISRLVSARNDVAAAASRWDIPATGTACQTATDAVETLRDHLPSPEAAVNQLLQQAISSYASGLPVCVSASGRVDGTGMRLAAWLISAGDTAMQSALDILGDESDVQSGRLGVLIV